MIVTQSEGGGGADQPQQMNISATQGSNKPRELEPPPSPSLFPEIISRLMGRPATDLNATRNKNANDTETNNSSSSNNNSNNKRPNEVQPQPTFQLKRACRAPLSRKFAHPCTCQFTNQQKLFAASANNGTLPLSYSTPVHLYDPASKKCLSTSRNRDMLLKECRSSVASPYPLPHQLYPTTSCIYEDLLCDSRRNRCVCKPPLHLYYESNTTFGCVPMVTNSPDNRITCKPGQVYNILTKDCQKIFDVNELPPTNISGVSATQFSFVTIVLIWILLLILIVTAKLRKLRASNLYRNSPNSERRSHHHNSHRSYQNQSASAWLQPFLAAVNGHHHMGQQRATDRPSQIDDFGNFNDTDFFLARNNQRPNGMMTDGNFVGSQMSLNNPPPKFEEIYPGCPQNDTPDVLQPTNEDLPSYDEAMKLQNTTPSVINPKE